MTEHAPGIYFGLAEDEYHADPAVGSTSIKNVLVSPLTCWANSHMNPDYEEKDTDATRLGKAWHKLIVEGVRAFRATCAVKPDKADYPDAADGAAELRSILENLGEKRSGTIMQMCERILARCPDAELWPVIMRDWESAHATKLRITADQYRRLHSVGRLINQHPSAHKAFSGGYPEVSIFWVDEETGLRMKCRIDYLKTKSTVDLKTFSNPFGKPIDTAIAHAIANHRYHVQVAMYADGVEQAKQLVHRHGMDALHGEPEPLWLSGFLECTQHAFVFVFVETGAAPNIRVREFRRGTIRGGNLYWMAGHAAYRMGARIYAENLAKHGTDPWVDDEPMTPFVDEDFPMWMMD